MTASTPVSIQSRIMDPFSHYVRLKLTLPLVNLNLSLRRLNQYKPSETTYFVLVGAYLLYSLAVGYYIATMPTGEWREFSWHPFLMTFGFVGCIGVASVTKKLGGYTKTKVRDF